MATLTADGSADLPTRRNAELHTIYANGTWGGGTITLEVTPDNVTWFDVDDVSLTADGFASIALVTNGIRVTLAGATSPNLTVQIMSQGD